MSTVLDYKCPACGGAVDYVPGAKQLKCPFCDSVFNVEDYANKDTVLNDQIDVDSLPKDDFNWNTEGGTQWNAEETDGITSFICQSCGGEIIGDKNMAATECPYCGNNVVIAERLSGSLKPDYVIPFELDKNQAKECYKKHISGKFLLPKMFKDENHIDEIKGVYIPFWLFDSKVNAFARFEAENTRCWSDSRYEYTEVTTYDVFRSGRMAFEHIPVDGSEKTPDDLTESLEPFDFSRAVPFQTAYLAGFFADKYDVDGKMCQPRANERIRKSTIEILRNTVQGYDSVCEYNRGTFSDKFASMEDTDGYVDPFASANTASNGVELTEGSIRYALYPVYLLTSTYKGQKYTFAMNGQTGKFVGDLPIDKAKKNLTFAAVFAAVTALVTVLITLFMG